MESNKSKKNKPYLAYFLSALAGVILYQLIKYIFKL